MGGYGSQSGRYCSEGCGSVGGAVTVGSGLRQ